MEVGIRMRMIVTVTIGLVLLASGSVRAQGVVLPLPAQDQQKITAQLGPGVVGIALPSQPISDPRVFFPLQNKSLTYQVMAGPNAGKSQSLELVKTRRPSGASAWRFQLSPSLAGFLRQTAEGDIIMPALSDAGEGVVVVTTPANPFVPKGMQPGETRTYSQQVSVNYLDDPSDQKYSGSVTGNYTYVGTYQVTVPTGSFPAAAVPRLLRWQGWPCSYGEHRLQLFRTWRRHGRDDSAGRRDGFLALQHRHHDRQGSDVELKMWLRIKSNCGSLLKAKRRRDAKVAVARS